MKAKLIKELEEVISACARKAASDDYPAIAVLQYTQACVNASNALLGLDSLTPRE